ncbi:PREDICTED: ornithine decarboxylase-like [Nicrophorus vespilloides]|uniref:ornithine decarboxylase n=1 Tax=Nicrophorus vespilloides TaxID=110193 RepID=A0ABM1MWX7_NICVS|nr:PREDICTED: ornithine decarboxylase-like [Nicrophorus vespilloides]XP_017779077.1 PREDICTED: ornithine decarboxylase-like [Nicrophorus vespilloides]
MKITKLDERVHVLDSNTDALSILQDIVESGVQEEAFYICDVGDIVRKHKIFKAAMPRVEPHYAVKCNDSHTVLETLAALGTGFDCASKTEINKVLTLGVNPSRIIFANPAKPMSHIRHAAATGVRLMTFDNESELFKIKDIFPDAKMVIRIRCDATIAQCQLGMKFGCDPVSEAPQLLDLARSLGIDVVGVSFHVGSGCGEPAVFRRAIAASRDIFDYAETLGFNFNLLDLGGGYPGGTGSSIDKIADIINRALEDYFPDPAVNVIAEPGRFYVASAYTLACNIHSIRTVNVSDPVTGNPNKHIMYYINDGVYGSFNCLLYDHQHVVPIPLKINAGAKYYRSSVWGPTCDGLDQVVENHMLPEMKIGDWLIFEDMGAYTLPVASPFNGFPIPKVHVVADQNIWMLLKDMFPLSENHFVIGNTKANLRVGLDTPDGWTMPSLPITIPICNGGKIIEEHILDYVQIGSLN